MYICVCKGVSEKDVDQLLLQGRRKEEEIIQACGAGTDCGSCRRRLQQKLERELNAPAALPAIKEPSRN